MNTTKGRSRRSAPLRLSFVGTDTILALGAGYPNTLGLQITNVSVSEPVVFEAAGERPSRLALSTDIQPPGERRDWALGTASEVAAMLVGTEPLADGVPWTVTANQQGARPEWLLSPTRTTTLEPGRSLTIRLVDVTSSLSEGVAHFSVVCRDLAGFADTTLTVPVRKTTQCIAGLPIVNGGTIRWGGAKGRLAWSEPFYAVAPSSETALGSGHIVIEQPEADIPAEHVHDGVPRSATAEGVVLDQWEMLFAVHDLGRGWGPVSYRIVRMGDAYVTAGNWLLVATVNGSNDSITLGTGATLGARGTYSGGSTVPNGMIMMWSGAVADIPAGWALCDTRHGTPDLRDRFIVGVGGRYEPEQTGGFDTVPLTINHLPAHSHSATMDQRGGHWHRIEGTNASGLRERIRVLHGDTTVDLHWGGNTDADVGDTKWRGMATTDVDGAHAHEVGVTATGGGQSHENRPPFFALAFIMKI